MRRNITDLAVAALARVPEIKPSDVQEVFFGNVLSAKYVLTAINCSIADP